MATKKQLFIYTGLIFLFSWAIQIAGIISSGDINNTPLSAVWLMAAMLSPLTVTVFFLARHKSLRKELWWKPNKKVFAMSLMAVLIPTVIAFLVLATIQWMGYGQSGWFSFSSSGVNITGGPFLLGKGAQSWLWFILNVFVTGVVYALLNSVVAAGEEFAWRGFLQSQLIKKWGTVKGILLLGFIWSMWHLPVQLAGYNYPEYPVFGAFILSPLLLTGYSCYLAWITIKSKSFIPAAIAHGAINGIEEGIIGNINMPGTRIYEDVATVLFSILAGVLFMYIIKRKKLQKPV